MSGLSDVLGGVYREDDPPGSDVNATAAAPPVEEVEGTAATLGWDDIVDDGPDVPGLPDPGEVDAAELIPSTDPIIASWDLDTDTETEAQTETDEAAATWDLDAPAADDAPAVWTLEDDDAPPAWSLGDPEADAKADAEADPSAVWDLGTPDEAEAPTSWGLDEGSEESSIWTADADDAADTPAAWGLGDASADDQRAPLWGAAVTTDDDAEAAPSTPSWMAELSTDEAPVEWPVEEAATADTTPEWVSELDVADAVDAADPVTGRADDPPPLDLTDTEPTVDDEGPWIRSDDDILPPTKKRRLSLRRR